MAGIGIMPRSSRRAVDSQLSSFSVEIIYIYIYIHVNRVMTVWQWLGYFLDSKLKSAANLQGWLDNEGLKRILFSYRFRELHIREDDLYCPLTSLAFLGLFLME